MGLCHIERLIQNAAPALNRFFDIERTGHRSRSDHHIGTNKVQDFRIHYLPSHVRLTAFLQGPDFNTNAGIQGIYKPLRPGSVALFRTLLSAVLLSAGIGLRSSGPKSQDRTVLDLR